MSILFCIGLISVLCPQDVYRAHTFHSEHAGAIAGGTVGGVILIAVISIGGSVFIVKCFCTKNEDVSGSELTHILHE